MILKKYISAVYFFLSSKAITSLSGIACLGIAAFLISACKEDVDSILAKKEKENRQQIEDYLAEKGLKGGDNQGSTNSGLYYVIDSTKTCPKDNPNCTIDTIPDSGDQISIEYKASLLNGYTFDSSPDGNPFHFALDDSTVIDGLNEGIKVMQQRKAKDARLFIPAKLGYKDMNIQGVPPYSVLLFEIHNLTIRTEEEVLKDYIKVNKYTASKVDSVNFPGLLYYKLPAAGQDDTLKVRKQFTVSYTRKFANGKIIDNAGSFTFSSESPQPEKDIIIGLIEGVKEMKKLEKRVLFIPSAFAYGNKSSKNRLIPPYSPLIYEVQLLDVK